MTTIANQINHHIFPELFAEISSQSCDKSNSFGIISVDMENRCLNHFCNFRAISGHGLIQSVCGGKTNLVVDNNMQGSTNKIAFLLRHVEQLHVDTLTFDSCITMNQNRENMLSVSIIITPELSSFS